MSSLTALLSSITLRRIRDPSHLELTGLDLHAIPGWLRRIFLSSSRLRKVNCMVVIECSGVTADDLAMLLCSVPRLQSLQVHDCTGVSGLPLQFVSFPTALHALSLRGAQINVEATRMLTLLSTLKLDGCRLETVEIGSSKLADVALVGCAGLTDDAVTSLIARSPCLRSLDISESSGLLRLTLPWAPSLERLHVEDCAQLEALPALDTSCPALCDLSVAFCTRLCAVGWPVTLRQVNLARSALGDEELSELCRRCATTLEVLVVRGCETLRAPLIAGITLRRLDVSGCTDLSLAAVEHALSACARLEAVDARDCAFDAFLRPPHGAEGRIEILQDPLSSTM